MGNDMVVILALCAAAAGAIIWTAKSREVKAPEKADEMPEGKEGLVVYRKLYMAGAPGKPGKKRGLNGNAG